MLKWLYICYYLIWICTFMRLSWINWEQTKKSRINVLILWVQNLWNDVFLITYVFSYRQVFSQISWGSFSRNFVPQNIWHWMSQISLLTVEFFRVFLLFLVLCSSFNFFTFHFLFSSVSLIGICAKSLK